MFLQSRDHIIDHVEKLLAWSQGEAPKEREPVINFKKTAAILFFSAVGFLTASLISFAIVSSIMGPESTELKNILKNWDDSRCGETLGPLDMTDALYNGNLNGCGAPLYLAFFYLFYVVRSK